MIRLPPPSSALLAILALAPLLPAPLAAQDPVPSDSERAEARTQVLETLIDWIVLRATDDVDALVQQMLAEAKAQPAPATRYVLLEQCLRAARRGGSLRANLEVAHAMSEQFAVDPVAVHLASFEALRARSSIPVRNLVMSLIDLMHASVEREISPSMNSAAAAAIEWARKHGDGALLRWTERSLAEVATIRAAWERIDTNDSDAVTGFRCKYRGVWHGGEAVLLNEPEALASKLDCVRIADRLRGLAAQSDEPLVIRHLRERAYYWYRMAWLQSDGLETQRIVRQMSRLEDQLAQAQDLGALSFDTAAEIDELVFARGEWRIDDGKLNGRAGDSGIASTATLRLPYESMQCVIVRGGILSPAGLNFRLEAGSCNALFNWEVADENHIYFGDTLQVVPKHRFAVRQTHDFRLRQLGPFVVAFLDGVELCRQQATLSGTVSVYPALHSEIFVEELAVLGSIDRHAAAVIGPFGHCR